VEVVAETTANRQELPVTSFALWTFPDADGAQRAEAALGATAAREHLTVYDGAVVTWPDGRNRPRKRELQGVARTAILGEAFWGLLFGTAFFAADLQALTRAGPPAAIDAFDGVGIGGDVMAELTEWVVVGTSALLVLADKASCEVLGRGLAAHSARTLQVLLSADQNLALRRVFTP
jgi:uncharacterized membrane protein